MQGSQDAHPTALITGLGFIAPGGLEAAFRGQACRAPEAAPEITGFETPDGAPAFGFELAEFKLEDHLPHIKTYLDRTSALALAAARLALADAGLLDGAARPAGLEIGCAYGATLGCLEAMGIFWKKVKSSNPKFAPPLPFTHGYANSPSSLLCIEYGLRGSAATFSGDWLSGIQALHFALTQVFLGSAQAVLVGASDSLTSAAHAHLLACGCLSRSGRLRPWSAENDGVVPGEGAAFAVIESTAGAAARGRRPYAELAAVGLGAGESSAALLDAWRRARAGVQPGTRESPDPTILVAATPLPPALDRAELGGWAQCLKGRTDVSAIAPKLLTGELLSVSPVLGTLLGAAVLSGKLDAALLPAPSCPMLRSARGGAFSSAIVGALDPGGTAGVVALRKT
jgi:3-oxoacyl-(acyl-carrier-protein) synthase